MAPKAQTARQSSRGISSRRARQDNLPYPLSSPTAASYRSPPWQQRVDVYAQNYLVPAEIATCRQLGLRFLPTEARLIASQLAGSPSLSLKVRQFIGSLYIYDLAYGLLHDMKSQLRAVLGGGEEVETLLVANLLNNIRGYRIVQLVKIGDNGVVRNGDLNPVTIIEKPWAGVWQLTGVPAQPADPEINMKVLSSTQENILRSKGYVIIDGMPYTVERYPQIERPVVGLGGGLGPILGNAPRTAPYGRRPNGIAQRDTNAGNNNFLMAPYSLTGVGGYAVESCINMLIELCNDARYNTAHFTQQSRMNVFYPLGLEGPNAGNIVTAANDITQREMQNNMMGMANLMGNYQHPTMNQIRGVPVAPPTVAGMANGALINGTVNDNVLRKIQVPGSITGASKTQNAAVMEHQRMILTQRDLLGRLGQWIETGEGILAYGGVSFGAYRRGQSTKDVMGNRPATTKFMEANYTNDTCGAGYERVWYTGQPDDPKSSQVPGYLSLPGGRTVRNIKAKVATCAPVMPQTRRLPGSSEGPNVMTNMVYPTIPRTGGVVAMQRRKKKAATKKR